MLAEARRQLASYPDVSFVEGRAESAAGVADDFSIAYAGGSRLSARRIILAHGVIDTLPDIPGLAEEWGRRVAHCPYCHGYEFDSRPLGVLANGPAALHQAMLVREWGQTTLFLNGAADPSAEEMVQLERRGIAVERGSVEAVLSSADSLMVRMVDGRESTVAGLFTQPRARLSSGIAEQLGCSFKDGPFGPYVSVDERQRTSVAGVLAAGDMARAGPNVAFAVADGAMAGAAAHQSLVFD
jgi:thioredoxin reductase